MLKRYDLLIDQKFEEQFNGLAESLGLSVFSNPVIECSDTSDGDETAYRLTGKVVVSFVFSENEMNLDSIESALANWLADYGLHASCLSKSEYSQDHDWMQKFREYFKPVDVTEKIVIRPPWFAKDTKREKTEIIIDPGMAFGTGTHETTRLSLVLLEKINVSGCCFLDLGAGSGVLSFYLLKNAASRGIAVEVESTAVENLKKNMKLNLIDEKVLDVRCCLIKDLKSNHVDIIVANITTPVILEHIVQINGWLKPGGTVVFSGVNVTNRAVVKEAFNKQGLTLVDEIFEGDWYAFCLKK